MIAPEQPNARAKALLFFALALVSIPAHAGEVAGTISIKSDDRFRGRSLSDGRPVVAIGASFDSKNGPYLGTSATAILTGERRSGVMGAQIYGGYAKRTISGIGFDIGLIGYAYSRRYSGNRNETYAEAYAGISKGALSAYVHFTPDYFGRGTPVVYASLSANKEIAPNWRLSGQAGVLIQTSGPPGLGGRTSRYDAKLAISRTIGKLELQAVGTLAGPDDAYYAPPWRGRSSLSVAATYSF